MTDKNLPENFNHFKIVQISDLHNCFYDKNNESILSAVRREKPDIIAITGDYVDKNTTDTSKLIKFSKQLTKIADCYYITGNHEAEYCSKAKSRKFFDELKETGINFIDDTSVKIERNGQYINIAGLSDPLFREIDDKKYTKTSEIYSYNYKKLNVDGYTVLLSHRPYEFETYVKLGPNIVLSGHEHGGQIRIPFIGGFFAPGEGLFPKYDSGVFEKGHTTMIVSRGIGNSEAPIRINDQPEIIIIEIER